MSTRSAKQTKAKPATKAAPKTRAKTAGKAFARSASVRPPGKAPTRLPVAVSGKEQAASVPAGTLLPAAAEDFMAQLDRWFERSFGRWMPPALGLPGRLFEGLGMSPASRMPRVDVLNRDADVLVRAELPGIDKKNVQISVTGHTLTIRAEAGTESQRKQGEFFHQEISHRSYERTIALPSGVDTSRTRASLNHGVLEISIPKEGGGAKKAIDVQ